MNKKGETGPIAAIFLFIVFLLNWFVWLGAWINIAGDQAAIGNPGILAFFFHNLNFFIFICMLLGMMGWMYFGSE